MMVKVVNDSELVDRSFRWLRSRLLRALKGRAPTEFLDSVRVSF